MASRPRRGGDEVRARDPRARVGWDLAEHVVSEEHLEILAHLRLRNPPLVHGASDHVGAGHGLARLGVLVVHHVFEGLEAFGPLVLTAHVHPSRTALSISAYRAPSESGAPHHAQYVSAMLTENVDGSYVSPVSTLPALASGAASVSFLSGGINSPCTRSRRPSFKAWARSSQHSGTALTPRRGPRACFDSPSS